MAVPNNHHILCDFKIEKLTDGQLSLPQDLINLFVKARSEYQWPTGTGSFESQKRILELEEYVNNLIKDLTPKKAKLIIESVSKWADNNQKAQRNICQASSKDQQLMFESIEKIVNHASLKWCLETLSSLPGLRLVIATKVYRFCVPDIGAAVDRHASYFFNSLRLSDSRKNMETCTKFKREWSNGKHKASRLAIYQKNYHQKNLNEYIEAYLPMLDKIAKALNSKGITYICMATSTKKAWRPCDIEMAAYYWWAKNGLK